MAPSPRSSIDPLHADPNGSDNCFVILGLSPAATEDEIKDAYRAKVRQNHPDRVHGLAPAFHALAEAETKKLNMAYEEALVVIQGADQRGTCACQSERHRESIPVTSSLDLPHATLQWPSCRRHHAAPNWSTGRAPGVPEDSL